MHVLYYLVWREIPWTDDCSTCNGGSCWKCDNGYCCSKDGPNGDCPKNAIDALSTDDTTEYRCVQERDVLGKNDRNVFFEDVLQQTRTEY